MGYTNQINTIPISLISSLARILLPTDWGVLPFINPCLILIHKSEALPIVNRSLPAPNNYITFQVVNTSI